MIEVLKQALEALQDLLDQTETPPDENCSCHIAPPCSDCVDYSGIRYAIKQASDTITSLRQAIAEAEAEKQEGQSNFCAQCEALSRELKAIKQEQGEPVGYLEIDDIESQREYPHNCRNVNLWYESGEGLVAVYTHPPQRKPLTDEQILANETLRYHFGLNGGAGPVSKKGRAVIDAIEAAHGITKGQP